MSQEWYYAKGDQKQGPITSGQLKGLAKSGALKPTDLVWTEGMKDWEQAGSVTGLFPGTQSLPPPLGPTTTTKTPVPVAAEVEATNAATSGLSPHQPWYCHWAVLGLATLIFFPVTLVLVWWKGTYSKKAKWAWTGACWVMWLVLIANSNAKKNGETPVVSQPAINTPKPDVAAKTGAASGGKHFTVNKGWFKGEMDIDLDESVELEISKVRLDGGKVKFQMTWHPHNYFPPGHYGGRWRWECSGYDGDGVKVLGDWISFEDSITPGEPTIGTIFMKSYDQSDSIKKIKVTLSTSIK